MTRFDDVVTTSTTVASTRSRATKISAIAELLRTLDADEIEPAVGMLTGVPRQGRIGVGWRTLYDLEVAPAAEATLTIGDVDRAVDQLAACSGAGSNAARTAILSDLFQRALEPEQSFFRRMLTGELRQGALE